MATLESPVAQALIAFIRDRLEWEGTATELLKYISPALDGKPNHDGWPRNGRGMTSALNRLAPALRRIGISVERLERSDAKGTRRIRLACKVSAQPSEPSEPPERRRGAGFRSDGSKRPDDSTVREPGNSQRPSEKNSNKNNATDGSDGPVGTLHTKDDDPNTEAWSTRI